MLKLVSITFGKILSLSIISSLFLPHPVEWQIPIAVYTVLRYSWWWTVDLSETCRILYRINLRNCAPCRICFECLLYKNITFEFQSLFFYIKYHNYFHSFSSLPYDRSKASSKASCPHSAIYVLRRASSFKWEYPLLSLTL